MFGLLGLAVGYPEAGFALGSALVSEPEPQAPAPYVVVKIGGDTYRISATGQTLAPEWAQPIAVASSLYPPDSTVLIQVRDAIDDGVLGQRELRLRELLQPGDRTLTDLGEVSSLDVSVAKMPARSPFTVALHVDAQRTLQSLVAGGDSSWAAIPVWNGDRVSIQATGQVCPSQPTPCFGPEGAEPGRWSRYNYSPFEDAPHASLVAFLPTEAVVVGEGVEVVAEESGFLVLFVNDEDVDNNEGGFDVRVTVEPGGHR